MNGLAGTFFVAQISLRVNMCMFTGRQQALEVLTRSCMTDQFLCAGNPF